MVMMYDKSSTATGAQKQRPYQAIPPTRSALLQHAKRAAYLADCYGANQHCASQKYRALLTGAKKGGMCNVVWTMLPPIVESCQQVTKCGCKSECHGRLNVTALVSPALHCVVAGARLRRVFENSKDNITSDRSN